MQLILEPETSNIDIKKMSAITEQSPIEKSLTNGLVQENNGDLPVKNKEYAEFKTNIIEELQEITTLNENKQNINENGANYLEIELKKVETNLDDASCNVPKDISQQESNDNQILDKEKDNVECSVESQSTDVSISEKGTVEHNPINLDEQQDNSELKETLVRFENKNHIVTNDVENKGVVESVNTEFISPKSYAGNETISKTSEDNDDVVNVDNKINNGEGKEDVLEITQNDITFEKDKANLNIQMKENKTEDFMQHENCEMHEELKPQEKSWSTGDCDALALNEDEKLAGIDIVPPSEDDELAGVDRNNDAVSTGDDDKLADVVLTNAVPLDEDDELADVVLTNAVPLDKEDEFVDVLCNNDAMHPSEEDELTDVVSNNNVAAIISEKCEEMTVDPIDSRITATKDQDSSHDSMECDEVVGDSTETNLQVIDNSIINASMECDDLIVESTSTDVNVKESLSEVTIIEDDIACTETTTIVSAVNKEEEEMEESKCPSNFDSTETQVLSCNEPQNPTENSAHESTISEKVVLPGNDDICLIAATSNKVITFSSNQEIHTQDTLTEKLEVVPTDNNSTLPIEAEVTSGVSEINNTLPAINDLKNNDTPIESNMSSTPEVMQNDSEVNIVTDTEFVDLDDEVSSKCPNMEINDESNVNEKNLNAESDGDNVIEPINKQKDTVVQSQMSNLDIANDDVVDIDDIKLIDEEDNTKKKSDSAASQEKVTEPKVTPLKSRLSNTLDILSDDEDEPPTLPIKEPTVPVDIADSSTKQCIELEDDDDIMLIDEDKNDVQPPSDAVKIDNNKLDENETDPLNLNDIKDGAEQNSTAINERESIGIGSVCIDPFEKPEIKEKMEVTLKDETPKPLVSVDFLKSFKKNLVDMTRDDLEEFCILKIVESVIDRSNISDINTKLKTMAQNIEEYKKKAMMLTKQNRDLQVVLKSVQEELKKGTDTPITPLKITRSVGMQVLMTDKMPRRKVTIPIPHVNNVRPPRNAVNQSPRPQLQATTQQIPVPRLVPATISAGTKTPNVAPQSNNKTAGKVSTPLPNGVRNSPPAPKSAEKRSRVQSVTVDLTDDEPPAKVPAKNSPAAVRLVNQQNLIAPRPQLSQPNSNSPRKVYIPISGPQGQNVRPGQTIMLKSVPPGGPRPRAMPPMVRMPQNTVRLPRVTSGRHPAPLPDAMKQYQPPNWKALPPAPDLKLSKVENGIVISWKIEGFQEDSYEEIASYQLYAYQETTSPPSTTLWKKIGDVKALPLPMACTLTQFMAGYKYYFAVRAVDIRSRLGPFSLPGSILLLNKM